MEDPNAAADEQRDTDMPAALEPDAEKRKQRAAAFEGARELRRFGVEGFEMRETSDGMVRFSGWASVTEVPYEVGDYREIVARGAFRRTLNESPDVVLLINHDGLPLARTKSGTLTLSEDARGLRVEADLDPEDPDVASLQRKFARGDLDGQMSFAFRVTDQEWSDDYTERTIKAVTLHRGDVSIVTMGANPATTSDLTTLRSEDGVLELRVGKTFSAANVVALQGVLDRLTNIDNEADASLEELSATLGVPNPDDDAEPDADDSASPPPKRSAPPVDLRARRFREEQRLQELRNRRKAA